MGLRHPLDNAGLLVRQVGNKVGHFNLLLTSVLELFISYYILPLVLYSVLILSLDEESGLKVELIFHSLRVYEYSRRKTYFCMYRTLHVQPMILPKRSDFSRLYMDG